MNNYVLHYEGKLNRDDKKIKNEKGYIREVLEYMGNVYTIMNIHSIKR
ncbi:MAG: hypothetical protein HUJ72_11160 [Blautia sp.]|nr:hypothetical protein [Blautia sp.]